MIIFLTLTVSIFKNCFMLSFEYALTKNDYNNYYFFVTWDAPEKNKKRYLYFLRQLISVLIFTGLFYYSGLFSRGILISVVATTLIFLTSILSITGIRSSINKQSELITNDPDNESLFTNTLLSVSDTGFFLKDEFKECKFLWKAFVKKQENIDYYFLFYNSLEAIIIPKRIFKVSEEILFKKLLTQNLSFDAEIGHLIKSN